MADDGNRIGGPRLGAASGLDMLKQVLGPGPSGTRASGDSSSGGARGLGVPNGPRGMRMLSPDTPLDQLDRNTQRGTYLDILV